MAQSATELLDQLRQDDNAARTLERLRAEDVDTSPFEIPERESIELTPNQSASAKISNFDIRPTQVGESAQRAADAGVDVASGSPVGRTKAGFAGNDALRAEFLRKELSNFFGQDVRMRMGEESGELEFFNPETRRFTTVDEATITSNDLKDFLGDSLTLIGAGIGEMVGGVPGAAVGGTIGEGTRRGIGNLLGVNDESFDEAAKGSTGEGLLAGGGSAVARTVGATVKAVRDFKRPTGVNADVAEVALNSLESNQAIADEISRVSGQRFQPLTGQLSENETLLGAQSTLKNSPETAVQLRNRGNQNETALETFFDESTPQGATQSQLGREAQSTARSSTSARKNTADEIANTAIDELESLTESLPNLGDDTIGRAIREAVIDERGKIKTLEIEAYENAQQLYGLDEATGLSNIKIPVGDLQRTFNALSSEAKEALFSEQAAGKAILTPKSITESSELDLHQMEEAIRFLRRRQRLDSRNAVAASPQGRDVNRALQALIRQRSAFLAKNHPDVLEAIESAEFISSQRARLFDKSILKSLLVRDESGEYVLRDRDVIARTIASGDKEATQHLMNILSENPMGQAELQKTMLAFYRNEVIEDGIPNLKLHKRFIERHGDAVDVIFPNSPVKKFGEFAASAEKLIARADRFKTAVNNSFKGRLQDIAPENVVRDMFTRRFSVKDASRFRNLAQAGQFFEPYERAVGDEIRRRIFTNGTLSPTKLDSFLAQHGETVKGLLGPRYVADLQTLLKGIRISNRQPSGISTRGSTTLFDAMRVLVAPPLTRRGRFQTLLQNVNRKAVERATLNAVLDPQALRAIVAQRNSDIRSKKVLGLLGALGGAAIGAEE